MLSSSKYYTMFNIEREFFKSTRMLSRGEHLVLWMLLLQASILVKSSHQLSTINGNISVQSNQDSKLANNTNQSANDPLQQQPAAVDDLLKDTFMLLDVLDQKLASVNNKTPNAMMRDNLRALDGATDGEFNSDHTAFSKQFGGAFQRSSNDINKHSSDSVKLDEVSLNDDLASGQSNSNKDHDSILAASSSSSSTTTFSNENSQQQQQQYSSASPSLVKYHQSETSSLTTQDGGSVSSTNSSSSSNNNPSREAANFTLNESKGAAKRSKQLTGSIAQPSTATASSLAPSFSDTDNQLASDSTERHIKFTLDLMQSIFSSQSYSSKTNLIESFLISPLSIQMVLMMMHLGARGQTRREISNCLHLTQATPLEKVLAATIQQQHPVDLGVGISNADVASSSSSPSSSSSNISKLKRRHHYSQQQQQQQQQGTTESVKQQNANGKSQQQQAANLRQQTLFSSQQQQQQLNGNGNHHEIFGASMRNLLKDPIVMKALTSANQIFLQRTLLLSPQYEWAIKHYYSADVKLVDFQHHSTSTASATTAPSSSASTTTPATTATQPTNSIPSSSLTGTSTSTASPNSISLSSSSSSASYSPLSALFTSTSPTTPNLPNVGLTNAASASQTQHVSPEKGKPQANADYQALAANVTANATYSNEQHSHHHHHTHHHQYHHAHQYQQQQQQHQQQQQQQQQNRIYHHHNNILQNQQKIRAASSNFEQEQANDVQQMVNDWVERQTKGRISNFLSSPISTSTLMMAINVLYFRGDWQYKFDPSDTETDAWFTQANGKMTKIPMMVNRLPLAFAHDPQMKTSVIELPYKAQRLGLFLLLPDEVSGIFHTMRMLNSTSFANLISSMRKPSPTTEQGSNGINVRIPKFSIESSPRLSQILSQQLGLKSLFMPDTADLSGMFAHMQNSNKRSNNSSTTSDYLNQQLPLQVGLDELLHKAVLQVDEQGSVAAASSATIVERVGVFNSNYFEADHPFLLFLMDKQTGLVLFSGAFAGNNNNGGSDGNNNQEQRQHQHKS